jgi:acetyl-CoA acetyltransferase
MQTTRFMFEHDVTQESLAEVVLTSYAHAQHNPRATRYGSPLTMAEYRSSRWIAEPFRLYDCCPENDGAAAIVVTTAERGRDLPMPVGILAAAQGLCHGDGVPAFGEANFPTAHYRLVGRLLWERAGVGPADVDVAQFYENFSGPVLMALSEMGFCDADGLNEFAADGGMRWRSGHPPINTSGGNVG